MLHPILQDPAYHLFADHRTLLGIPNFWNVITNLAFLAAALLGWRLNRFLAAATAAVGLGSAWYHLQPDDAHLFWDRLPMAVVFMALIAELTPAPDAPPHRHRRSLGPLLANHR